MTMATIRYAFAQICVLASGICTGTQSFADQTSPTDGEARALWTANLPDEITGICFQSDRSGATRYFVCAGHKLVALNSDGMLIKGFRGVADRVERLVPLGTMQGNVAFLAYRTWGEEILFFDRQGAQIGRRQFDGEGIDWVAADGRHVLVGLNGSGGLRLLEFQVGSESVELVEKWDDRELGNCWNVALGRFGADFVATTSEAGGDLCFLTADGKQKTSIDFGYIASLDVLPVSPTEFAVIAINEFSEGVAEEVIAVRHDRVLFRQRIGHCGNKTWRTRRIVSGKLIDGKSTVIAVLRGDSSVVIFDAAGKPLHMLPSIHARTAIEPGPPDQGHDTLICCDGKTLRRFVFPAALPPEIAKERVTVKNPNEGFLKIEEQDSADELWARALWLSLPPNQASSDEVASLFSAALSRAKMKAPIYVSFGDAASGPNVMREMLNRAAMALTSAFATDLASNARPLARKLDLPKDESTKLLELTIQKSFENALKQDRVRGEIDALVANMKDGSDASMTYYVAAIAEDQDFMPAWYRLATRSKGEQRSHAVAEFIRRDSENALPHYLRAADEIENGDLSAGLKSVQAGNRLKACRIYNSPRPKAFALKWPDNEFCREFGVVGAPLHKTALDFLLDEVEQSFTWNDPLTHDIRKIGRQLTEEGRRLQKDGQSADALSFLEAAEGLGIQLMKVEPRDAGMIVTGLGISRNCSDELKTAYKILGDEAKVRRAEEAEATCVRIRNEIIKALDARKLSKDDVKAILKGQNNPGEEARARLERALIHSGLITVPSDSKD